MAERTQTIKHGRQRPPAILERESRMVQEAIAMVARGFAPRVTLAGLRYGGSLLEPGRAWASEMGVRIQPLPRANSEDVDLSIEALAT